MKNCASVLVVVLCFVVALQVYMLLGSRRAAQQDNHPLHMEELERLRELNSTLLRLRGQLALRNSPMSSSGAAVRHISAASSSSSSSSSSRSGGSGSTLVSVPDKYINIPDGAKKPAIPVPISVAAVPTTTTTTKTAVLFTMDSMASYEADSKKGGASGEITIRRSLMAAFKALGVQMVVISSDAAFNRVDGSKFDIIILDPWTWAAPGWVPKANIRGLEHKTYILDFFGSPKMKNGYLIPPDRILTAFGSPWNTALGYFLNPTEFADVKAKAVTRGDQGVIWGKDPKHFNKLGTMLKQVADEVPLVATARMKVFEHRSIHWLGHQTRSSWLLLLAQSQFLLGMGNPLLGPSAIDAVACGAVYINPMYGHPVRETFKSQHDYALDKVGEPRVCSYMEGDAKGALACVRKAMDPKRRAQVDIPEWFQWENYLTRVKDIFEL